MVAMSSFPVILDRAVLCHQMRTFQRTFHEARSGVTSIWVVATLQNQDTFPGMAWLLLEDDPWRRIWYLYAETNVETSHVCQSIRLSLYGRKLDWRIKVGLKYRKTLLSLDWRTHFGPRVGFAGFETRLSGTSVLSKMKTRGPPGTFNSSQSPFFSELEPQIVRSSVLSKRETWGEDPLFPELEPQFVGSSVLSKMKTRGAPGVLDSSRSPFSSKLALQFGRSSTLSKMEIWEVLGGVQFYRAPFFLPIYLAAHQTRSQARMERIRMETSQFASRSRREANYVLLQEPAVLLTEKQELQGSCLAPPLFFPAK